MAIIEVSGHLQGESVAEAKAGLRMTASAACHGMSAAAQPAPAPTRAQQKGIPETPEPKGR